MPWVETPGAALMGCPAAAAEKRVADNCQEGDARGGKNQPDMHQCMKCSKSHSGSYKLWLWCNWSNEEQVWCQVCASEYFCKRGARRREATFIEMFGKRPIISVNSALPTSFEVSDEPMQFVHILKSLESWVSVGCTLH